MVSIAETLGFETIMRSMAGRDLHIGSAKAAMILINAERRSRGWTFADCQTASGICASTFFALASGSHDARMSTMVAIAGAMGFDLVLREREGSRYVRA
ncbi:hypothetical protein [Aminobacter sp. SS-2016]|uniref:hypothetical protein n=1 Tax=Aminobacter sp. Y103A TaxID=1870862 RepID=UPI0025727ACF|nr:hypothetical protein [Aminobacter sp. SS-2016]